MVITSANFSTAVLRVTVTNLDTAPSAPATMTIEGLAGPEPQADSARAGGDCTSEIVSGDVSQFICPVPSLPPNDTSTRDVTVQNLSNQGAKVRERTWSNGDGPGDTKLSNNQAFSTVAFPEPSARGSRRPPPSALPVVLWNRNVDAVLSAGAPCHRAGTERARLRREPFLGVWKRHRAGVSGHPASRLEDAISDTLVGRLIRPTVRQRARHAASSCAMSSFGATKQ